MKKFQFVWVIAFAVTALLVFGSACASKKFVSNEIASVDKKVASVSTEVESTQKRLKEHDEKLTTIGELIKKHDSKFNQVDGKIEEVRALAKGTLVMKETIRHSEARFAFNSAALSDDARTTIDRFVQRLISENKGVYIEIQGHTDNSGSDDYNLKLGEERARAVMMYLYKSYNIPLHRMAVVSFGSSKPLADNSTRQGRAENRRVEILVYE